MRIHSVSPQDATALSRAASRCVLGKNAREKMVFPSLRYNCLRELNDRLKADRRVALAVEKRGNPEGEEEKKGEGERFQEIYGLLLEGKCNLL